MKSNLALATLLLLVPRAVWAKERGSVVDIWEQRDSYGHRCYIYQVETETHVYDFLGDCHQAFQRGDSITLTFDRAHHHALWDCWPQQENQT
jgi:hypothetical protein